ncbi:MAG: sigma 54-interacting transcriptional regulator [Archangium sp.]
MFSVDQAQFARIELPAEGATWERGNLSGIRVSDSRMSRPHLRIKWFGGQFVLEDLGSTNGSFLNGVRFTGVQGARSGDIVRMGRTIVQLQDDVHLSRAYVEREATAEGKTLIIGPHVRAMLDRAADARARGRTLLIGGENGTGKELIAQHFHRSSAKKGPLIVVNCANLSPTTADAQLFGARKGVFTDVKERIGLVGAADGGVLYLDEVVELDLAVQAKLLRVLEQGEYTVNGDNTVSKVQVSFVTASHQSLPKRVTEGRFRQDLYFRLKQEEASLLPLRERREEIPWLMALEMDQTVLHHTLVEQALLRFWPGNLRELRSAVNAAVARAFSRHAEEVQRAKEAGEEPPEVVTVRDLDLAEDAGRELGPQPDPSCPPPVAVARKSSGSSGSLPAAPKREAPGAKLTAEQLLAALEAHAWNIKRTAEHLGLQRTQLYREIRKHNLKKPPSAPGSTLAEDEDDDESDSDDADDLDSDSDELRGPPDGAPKPK